MATYYMAVCELEGKFDDIEMYHVEHTENMAVDNLACMGAARELVQVDTFLEFLHKPSVWMRDVVDDTSTSDSPERVDDEAEARTCEPTEEVLASIPVWIQPLLAYLINGELPEDEDKNKA